MHYTVRAEASVSETVYSTYNMIKHFKNFEDAEKEKKKLDNMGKEDLELYLFSEYNVDTCETFDSEGDQSIIEYVGCEVYETQE